MRQTEKDKHWREMIRKQGALRHFGSMAIRKGSKGDFASAQEVDVLFRVALSGGMMTPGQLAADMGISKTMISRLLESLEKKALIHKEKAMNDRRSYGVRVTEAGKEEVDRMYYYYLDPLYTLRKQMTEEDFEQLFRMIDEANDILNKTNEKHPENETSI